MTTVRLVLTALSTAAIAIGATAAAQAAPLDQVARLNPKTGKHCVSMSVTGSMLPHRVCDSRQGWIDQGATLVAKADVGRATQIAAR